MGKDVGPEYPRPTWPGDNGIKRYPEPGEPPDVFKKWYFDRFGYDPEEKDIRLWKTKSAKELKNMHKLEIETPDVEESS